MNKKFIIIIGILLSMAGISFAAVLDNYGSAVGTANIAGPEFYLGSNIYETLLVNEKSDNCDDFGITGIYRTFKTKELSGINFDYSPKVQFSIRSKTATTTPQDLILSFGYYDISDVYENSPHYLCSEIIVLNNTFVDYTSDFIQCSGTPIDVKRFFYEFKKGCADCDYTISKCADGFYTKVKLDK